MTTLLKRAGAGAGVIVGLSVVPVVGLFAPLLGGGVAGWLSRDPGDSGTVAGAIAGLLASLATVPVFVAGSAVAATVSMIAAVLVLSVVFALVGFVAGVGAVGGYLGARATSYDGEADRESLDQLRQRYVEGELTDIEFEQRLERLLAQRDRSATSATTNSARRDDETVEHSKR